MTTHTISVREGVGIAIETRFLGPTDTKGSRIVARIFGHPWPGRTSRMVVGYHHADSPKGNHDSAAMALISSWPLDRDVTLACASTPTGYVYMVIP